MAKANKSKTYFEETLALPPEIYKNELAVISARRRAVGLAPPPNAEEAKPKPTAKDGLVGLALSGGGIRSATFSLGVIQALAAKHTKDKDPGGSGTKGAETQRGDYLRYVDYLSTVSGGGYIGRSLTWLLHSSAKDGGEDSSAQTSVSGQAADSQQNPKPPFGTRPENLPYGVDDPRGNRPRDSQDPVMLRHLREHGKYLTPGGGITLTSLVAVILRGIVLNMLVWMPLAIALMVVAIYASHALAACCPGLFEWSTMSQSVADEDPRHGKLGALLLWAAGLMAGLFVVASVVYSLASSKSENQGWYTARRWFESKIRWPLWAACGLVVCGSLPFVHKELDYVVEETGLASIILGGLTFLASLKGSGGKGGGISAAVVPVASALFLYGLALSAYWIALLYFAETWVRWGLLGAVILALITGRRVNLNYISIHRYYRDRLMETFMPDAPAPGENTRTGPAAGANKAQLSDMCGAAETASGANHTGPRRAT